MPNLRFLFLFLFFTFVKANTRHQQIHLSFGQYSDEMIVTWVTKTNDQSVYVRYDLESSPKLTKTVRATTIKFLNPGKHKRVVYIHRTILKNLEPGKLYKYQVMSSKSIGTIYTFLARNSDKKDAVTNFIMFADMGLNGTILPKLTEDVNTNKYDAIFHAGDISYDLNKQNGIVGDKFMNEIESIAARIPYQVAVGNHEKKLNFTHFVNRFTMVDEESGQINNHYYSFNLNNIHFIVYSTEFYYYTQFGTEQIQAQYNWLVNDLKRANQPENRALRPWIIALAHRSMYCNGFDLKDCIGYERLFRKSANYSLEKLFNSYSVDLHLAGHEHAYVKLFPIFDKKTYHLNKHSSSTSYFNYPAMVNIISGSASNVPEDTEYENEVDNTEKPEWVSKWSLEPSYTRVTVYNDTTLLIRQISYKLNEERILDELKLTKTLYRSF